MGLRPQPPGTGAPQESLPSWALGAEAGTDRDWDSTMGNQDTLGRNGQRTSAKGHLQASALTLR